MTTIDSYQKASASRISAKDDGIDLVKIFFNALSKWYYFVIGLILCFVIAYIYIGHTLPVYRVSGSILVNEQDGNASAVSDQLLQGFGMPVNTQNLDNQVLILSSRTVIEKALSKLPFEIEFFHRTIRNKLSIYPEIPVSVKPENGVDLPRNVEFSFEYLGDNRFKLATRSRRPYKIETQASFGDIIRYPGANFIIESNDLAWLKQNKDEKLYFVIPGHIKLVKDFMKRLKVESVTRDGTVIRISMEGTNSLRDADFLNKLTEVFLSISLDKKNTEAERRIQFINDQLVGISDSLVITETQLQNFRSRNRVMNLSAQGEVIIDQAMRLENDKARIAVETNYYDYLAEYLAKDQVEEVPTAPATMGILDPGLTRLVAELSELQGQLYQKSLGEKNPLQSQLVQRVRTTKDALRETLNGLRRANTLAKEENQAQIQKINNQASALPVTERQLLGIERKFKLNDELYTFLLEKRAEQQIQKASNVADNEVIDYADEMDYILVSPNKAAVYLLAWFFGIALPLTLILIQMGLNKTVKSEEISKFSDLPVVGNIPHSQMKSNTIVFNQPESNIAESFRLLRSRMQFFTKDAKSPVILVTSSLPDDGKTFVAINLASAYSLMGKKTILVGFDLRKPKIFEDFNISNEKGVSSWLIGKDSLSDAIVSTSHKNLSIIPAGPIPPNPSELTSLEKTIEFFKLLKNDYDFIIVDTSPIGIVSDTFHLASLADASLLVVRNNCTVRDIFERTLKEIKISDVKSISLVVNDLPIDDRRYGGPYGYSNYSEQTTGNKKNRKVNILKPGDSKKSTKVGHK